MQIYAHLATQALADAIGTIGKKIQPYTKIKAA